MIDFIKDVFRVLKLCFRYRKYMDSEQEVMSKYITAHEEYFENIFKLRDKKLKICINETLAKQLDIPLPSEVHVTHLYSTYLLVEDNLKNSYYVYYDQLKEYIENDQLEVLEDEKP